MTIKERRHMKELTPTDRRVINEWKTRQEQYEDAKKTLKDVLNKHGLASSEFNAARVDFEMLKEDFDNFEKENHAIISEYQR